MENNSNVNVVVRYTQYTIQFFYKDKKFNDRINITYFSYFFAIEKAAPGKKAPRRFLQLKYILFQVYSYALNIYTFIHARK